LEGLRFTAAGRKLLLATTGDLVDVAGTAEKVVGKWVAQSTQKDNQIRYTVDGAAQAPLKANYSFTKRNQLQVSVTSDGSASKFVFPGRIEVDSNHDFKYFIIDSKGEDTSAFFVLYGEFSFADTTVSLTIKLTGGGVTAVTGASGSQSLETVKNHMAGFDADDLLTFHARTVNVFDGVLEPVSKLAILDFLGNWDIQDGTIVFVSQVRSSPGSREVNLGFAGKFKAVTAGFVYFADASGAKAVLNIRGRHTFKGGAGSLAWNTVIGFSEKSFDAQVSVTGFVPLESGQSLTIDGKLAIKGGGGKQLSLDLSLQARYDFEAGLLVFRADIATGGLQPTYDLMLAGAFKYSNLNLTFQIQYTNTANAKKLTVAVGVQGSRDSMIRNLALMLDVSESEAKLKLNLTIEARIVLKNGVRVKELAEA
jgi:hypothetical protein